jgi:UDP-N-acetylglucosamine 2-epimerase
MIRYIIAIENMLDHEKPNLLVVMNETTMLGGVAVALAKSKGIRTICIQHGAMGDDAADILPVTVDKILVWGNSTKKILVDSHVPEEKIMITGPPQIDRKIIISDEEKKSIERIGVNRNKRIVFLTTQPIPEMNDIVIEVCKAVKGIENTQLVIKMHPAEFSPDMYKKIAKEVGIDAIITKDYLYPLIDACEVMVTSSSTVGIESLMLGKPVMTINLSVLPDIIPYARHKVAIGAYSKEDIKPKLELILKNKTVRDELMGHAQEFIHEFCYKMDGRSSERIIAVIKEMNHL